MLCNVGFHASLANLYVYVLNYVIIHPVYSNTVLFYQCTLDKACIRVSAYIRVSTFRLDFFFQFDAHTRCFLFDVEQDIELSNPEPAYVKIYDYYETGQW